MTIDGFVINLNRRPDRLKRFYERCDLLGISPSIQRIEAVDGRSLTSLPAGTLVDPQNYACWASHCLVYASVVEGSADYALVCEDDAAPDPGIDWEQALSQLPMIMEAHRLDYLQLGHISCLYPHDPLRRAIRRHQLTRAGCTFSTVSIGSRSLQLVRGASFAGTHCYVISRRMAELLPHYNLPTWVNADGFFDRLATAQRSVGAFGMGMLETSIVQQESRTALHADFDSD